jgi:hypothetical protein
MKILSAILLFLPFEVFADDTNALPALAPAYGEISQTFFEQHGTIVLIGVFAFLILLAASLWQLLKAKPPGALPPEVIARAALEKLKLQPEDGKILSEISQILRRYICAAFEFSTNEMTTAEFSAALAESKKSGDELGQAISNFLRECDERKFSPANPKIPFGAAVRALEIVEFAEKRCNELRPRIPEAK